MENTPTKYSVSAATAATSAPRHSALSAGNNAATNIIPIAFLSNAAAPVTGQGNNSNNANYTISSTQQQQQQQLVNKPSPPQMQKCITTELAASGACPNVAEPEDDYFCKTIGSYLRQLSRRHKIKAKVEMFQILEKYIELEESPETYREDRKG